MEERESVKKFFTIHQELPKNVYVRRSEKREYKEINSFLWFVCRACERKFEVGQLPPPTFFKGTIACSNSIA